MSNSPSNVFLVLNEVLEGIEVEQVKESATMQKMRVLAKERAEIQGEIHKKLEKKGVRFDTSVVKSESSFAVTEIPIDDSEGKYKIRLVYKRKGGGGSGAGAALTKLSESAQCMYAALAWKSGGRITNADVTCENFNDPKVKGKTLTDENYKAMCNDLPDDWINSCLAGAKKLYETYRGGNYTFHRGSPMVNQIEGHFKRIKKIEGVRMDLNKWSPADIYLIRKDFDIGCLAKEKTILGLNACMQRELSSGKLIGVSLKKITSGSAKLKAMNQSGTAPAVKYDGYELSPDSMDGYLKVKVNNTSAKIQFRSFGGETSLSGWQGEVKGASANQGKISYGPINLILRNHKVTQIKANAAADAKRNDDAVATQIAKGMIELGTLKGKTSDHIAMIKSKSNKWRYSKLQVVQLLSIIKNLAPEKRNQVMEDLFLYASSQSQYSAPYMKME